MNPRPPTSEEVEAQQAAFLESYDAGRAVDLSASEEHRAPMHIDVAPLKPNRKERRAARAGLRSFKVRATRERDREASAFGIPTPAGPIAAWIRATPYFRVHGKGLRP